MNNNKVVIGKIGAPFGIKGWVKVHSFTDPEENILQYDVWHLKTIDNKQSLQSFNVLQARSHGKCFVAQIEGIDSIDDARLLTNKEITVDYSKLPELEESYYWHDLIGIAVYTDKGKFLGKIVELFRTKANDVMVIKSDKEEHLIPYIEEEHVLAVDPDAKKMIVVWEFGDVD